MKINYPLQSKETKENVRKAKFVFFGFVLILAFICFMGNFVKVQAADLNIADDENIKISGEEYLVDVEIKGSTYTKYADKGSQDFEGVLVTANGQSITFIQGNGNNNEVDVRFTINNFPKNATAFMIVESNKTDSAGDNADADRYSYEQKYVLSSTGSGKYLKVSEEYYEILNENKYSDPSCSIKDVTGNYYKYSASGCSQIANDNTYNLTMVWEGSGTENLGSLNMMVDESGKKTAELVYKIRKTRIFDYITHIS